jgi:phage baseplate assembly protein W
MATYEFKSSGKKISKVVTEAQAAVVTPLPIGIKTPLQLGDDTILKMHTSLLDQMTDNLKNLLLTNRGERLALNDFGADLRRLTTEFTTDEDFDTAAMNSIQEAVAKWMPFIKLISFSSRTNHSENKETGIREITLTYTVTGFENYSRKLLVTLYVI